MSSADLAAIVGSDPLAILAGSGISIWKPTELPTGMQFTQGTFDALFRSPGMPSLAARDETFLEHWFMEGFAAPPAVSERRLPAIPFEVVMERCPRQDVLGPLVRELYDGDRANPVHDAVADLVASGRAASIITTNYDRGLDTALRAAGAAIPRVVRESDAPAHPNVYFKIHGTADAGFEDSLVYRLRAEGALPRWKRILLQATVKGRVLVVVGYSGVDFDICPELGIAQPLLVAWNFRTDADLDRSPGLRRLDTDGVPSVQLVGDMKRLLGLLCGRTVDAKTGTASVSIAAELRSRFSLPELLLWRSRVLNSMGHARLAVAAVAGVRAPDVPEFALMETRAQGLFHAGAYAASSNEFVAASTVAPDERARRMSLLDASDAARCHGRTRRAARLLERAVKGLPGGTPWAGELLGMVDLKRILLYRDRYEFARLLPVPGLRSRVRRRAEPLFERVARSSLEAGRWFDFQQVSLWANRMGIPPDRLRPSGQYAPPSAREGYGQLGYPVGVAMEACDRARRGGATLDELEWLLTLMQDFGANPQAWKVAYALVRASPSRARLHAPALLRAFIRCEYTPANRFLWLLRGS